MTTYVAANNAAGQNNGNTTTAGTVSITATQPATAATQRVFLYETATAATMSTPASWTSLALNQTIGSGAVAAGSGMRYYSVCYRDWDGSWSMPAMALTSSTQLSHWIGAVALAKTSSGYTWDTPTISTVGSDYGTPNTSHSAVTGSLTTHSSGFLVIGSTQNDNVTSTGGALSQSGATFGTVTERCDGGTATGNDIAGTVHTCDVTTGGTGALTFTSTLSAASEGGTVVIEQTETAPPPNAAMSTLTDDFNTGGTPDAAKWVSGGGTSTLTSGNLVVATNSELDSLVAYDLTGSYALCQVRAITALGGFIVSGGGTFVGWTPSSTSSMDTIGANSLSRTHTSGDWYRIRESGGTIFLDYSANGTSWTNLDSAPPAGTVDAVKVGFFSDVAGSNTFDNFNTAPVAPSNTGAFFTMF